MSYLDKDIALDHVSDDDVMMTSYLYSIDPVTGGPSKERGEGEGEREPMTEEEKEREAARLVDMMRRLNE